MIGAPAQTAAAVLTARVADPQMAEPSAEVGEAARRRVLDTLGALAAGRLVPGAELLIGEGQGDVVTEVRRLCAMARSTEVDDIDHVSCTTPGSVAVPVALVLGAALDVTGDVLLAAIAAGYEAMTATGDAIDGPRALYRGIWPSYLGAPLGAAATASRLLELDEDQTLDALGIAAARSAGLAGRPGREPSSRWFLYGCAAAEGVLAALAARRGLRGDSSVLDALMARVGAGAEGVERWRRGDRPPAVSRVDVKPFCTARQAQAAVEAARLAHRELGEAPLTAIEVRVPEAYRAMIDQPRPAGRLQSIMSAHFQIAAALSDQTVLFDVARCPPSLAPDGAAVAALVTVRGDAELDALYPQRWPATVVMRARDGREVVRRVLDPEGSPTDPAPGWEWLSDKHARLGALGASLTPAVELCRGLGGARRGEARALLEMTARLPETPARPPEMTARPPEMTARPR